MSHLLVVDWDFWFPNPMENGEDNVAAMLYDWGHLESRFHIESLWTARVSGFASAGLELPRAIVPSEGYAAWWDRFSIEPDTVLAVCDSNAYAGNERPFPSEPARGFESVWLFDAHHDCGYGKRSREDMLAASEFSCEDWMGQHYALGSELHMRYPAWKTNAFKVEAKADLPVDRQFDVGEPPRVNGEVVSFSHVLVCRSGAWVPPWCDDQFEEFYSAFPGDSEWIDTDFETPREFNLEVATAEGARMAELVELMRRTSLDADAAETIKSLEAEHRG